MNSTFKKVALASALLASSALVAPQAAFAASAGVNAMATTGGTAVTSAFNAPFTTAFQAGYGMRATISINPVGSVAANTDRYELVAFLYDASNGYVGYVRGAGTAGGNVAMTDTVTLPSSASGAAKVAFAFIPKVADDGAANLDDTIDSATAGTRALLVVPGAAENAATFTAVAITANASLSAGATAGELNTIGALAGIKAGAVALTSTYAGPTLVSAGKDALTPAYIKLTFDTILNPPGDNTNLATVGQIKPKAGATIETSVGEHNAKTSTGKDVYITKGTGGTAFSTAIDAIDISLLAGNSVTNSIQDKAGNHAKAVSGVTVSQFAKPAYAASGKTMVVTGSSNITYDDLFTTAGATAGGTSTLDISIRMAEAIGSNVNAADDFALSTGLTWDSVQTATGTTLVVRVGLTNGDKWRISSTNGELQRSTDGGTTWTSATVGLKVGATAVTTAEGQALTSALATPTVFAGVAPAVGNVSTNDADANGTVDGATIDFKTALTTPLAATNGVKVADDDDSTKTAAVTLSVPTATPNVLQIVSPEATLQTFLNTGSETAAANMNTGAVGTTLPYTVGVSSSEITYANVYDVSTGANKKIADISAASPANDGAKPVVISAAYLPEEGTSPAAGQLKIVASEALSTVSALDASQILFANSSLQLLNLNDSVKALGGSDGALSKTTVTNDTVTIGVLGANNGKVTANVAGKALTLGSAASGLKDAANNNLATDGTKTVTTGATVYAGPKIAQAIGTRSTNAVDGNIDQVVLKFDKGVTLASGGSVVDGLFKVKATVDGQNYTVSIPKANIDLTAAATGYVTLSIPAPGIVGSTKLTALVVEYDANGAGNVGTTSANRLISTDAVASEVADTNSSLTAGENDSDTRDVTFAKNTTKLYTMEVTGSLTTDGSVAAAKGTIVRADLVDFDTTLTFKNGSLSVPCSCTAGSTTIAVNGAGDIVDKLNEAVKLGKTSINAYAVVTLNSNQSSATGVDLASAVTAGSDTKKSYPITISTTGQVTGTAGATGSLTLEKAPALKVLDTVYQVTNTGAFRFAVGSDKAPTDAVVLVSSKQPADKFFTGLTSAVPSFANYLPFASNVVASGVIGGNLGAINLAKIASSSVSEVTGWQLVGFQGAIARNSNAALKAKGVDATRLLVSVRPTTGEPVTAWAFDTAANADDEAFLLQNNVTASALQIGSASIDGLKDVDGGLALALKNPSGGFTRDSNGNGEITSGDANTTIATAEPFSVFYPISGDSTAFNAGAGKWSLLTVEAAVSSANLATWATNNKVAAIIVVGSGNAQKSWFKGSTTNTLASLAKGDRAFIYFEAANIAYKFGR